MKDNTLCAWSLASGRGLAISIQATYGLL